MMELQLFEYLRGIRIQGGNLLEWLGVVLLISGAIYVVMEVRHWVYCRRKPKAPVVRPPPPEKSKPSELPQGDETILLVDDDPAVLRANSRLVTRLGYTVQKATGGREAVDFIKGNHADLIILDLLMPGMDGIETYQQIKSINPYQKAIVLSGFAGPAMVNSIKTLGVNTYLVKPVEIGMLARAIRDEIERPLPA